jgi:hypothetical protein
MTSDVGQLDSAMEQGEERRLPVSPTTPSCFLQICFSVSSFFSAVGKEVEEWWDIVREDVGCSGAITLAL